VLKIEMPDEELAEFKSWLFKQLQQFGGEGAWAVTPSTSTSGHYHITKSERPCMYCGATDLSGKCSVRGLHVRLCYPERPMPKGAAGRWEHTSAREIGDSDYSAHYECKDCGHRWSSELPE